MAGPLQFEVPTPLQYFAALVADDAGFSTLEAAVAVAQDDEPGLDVQAVLAEVDTLAHRLKRRVPADAAPLQRLRLLNHYFFGELGFAGNVNNYCDAANSLLPKVLVTRRGIPITLALLYIELATQLGLHAAGVSFPGHFLVKLQLPVGDVVIDPFSGQSLTPEELGDAWQGGRVHLTLQSTWNGRKVGMCEAGPEMTFHFGQLIAHICKTRNVRAGSIVGSGTVSNKSVDVKGKPEWPKGYSCIAEKRAIETILDGQPSTAFMKFGDTIRIEMKGQNGESLFGAIEQEIVPLNQE